MKNWKEGAWMAVVWVLAWLPVSILNARDRNNPIDQMIQQGEKAFLREQYSEALQFFVKAKNQAERVDSLGLGKSRTTTWVKHYLWSLAKAEQRNSNMKQRLFSLELCRYLRHVYLIFYDL